MTRKQNSVPGRDAAAKTESARTHGEYTAGSGNGEGTGDGSQHEDRTATEDATGPVSVNGGDQDRLLELGRYTPWTDAGNGELLAAVAGDVLRFDHLRKRWLIWDSHRWRPDEVENIVRLTVECLRMTRLAYTNSLQGDFDIDVREWPEHLQMQIEGLRKMARDYGGIARGYESKSKLDAMIKLARAQPPITDSGREWDAKTGIVGVPNGVIDLRTGRLRDGLREDRITMQLGVDFDPAAECPRWESFLLEVFDGDENVVRYVQRCLGAALAGDAPLLQIFWLLKGPGGNGKGALARALKRVFGDYAYELPAASLMASNRNAHSTDVAQMEHKRFVVCTELGNYDDVNADRVKQFSGADDVNARLLYREGRQIPPTWLLVLSTNTDPHPNDNSGGWWRRNRVLSMPRQFERGDEPGLEDTLAAEAPGILRWLIAGAVEYYKTETEGVVPVDVVDSTEELREDTDDLAQYFGDDGFLTRARGYWTPVETIWNVYVQWAEARGVADQFRFKSAERLSRKLRTQYGGKRIEIEVRPEEDPSGWKKKSGLFDLRVSDRYTEGAWVWCDKRGRLAPDR